MKTVRPILVLTADAPPLGMTLDLAAKYIGENFAAVQENFLEVLGCTFALLAPLTYRSPSPTPYDLWTFYGELVDKGRISIRSANTLYYMQVWHRAGADIATTGTQMGAPVGRCLDGAGPIEDFLGLRPDKQPINPGSTMRKQARGRIRHELEHGLGGPHPELVFGNWWDYGMPGSVSPANANKTAEIATLNKAWLVLR